MKKGSAAALDFVTRVFENVVVQPRDAREASDVFYKQKVGRGGQGQGQEGAKWRWGKGTKQDTERWRTARHAPLIPHRAPRVLPRWTP